ncbi:hypothetical protein J6590_001467 [Homalodisca vitripennis]|nr:hypothetical protein J6590_095673 [Homalodisca vitripennis]KAG8323721.1 hypothetical protein J6590_001467 [Homalodisca vitripennis]
MRDSHRQAMLRRKTTTGQAASAIKRWKFEEQMQFLLKTMTHRPSDTNVPATIHPEVATPEATDDLEHSEDDLTELQIEESEFPIPASPSTPRTEKRKRPDKGADKIITFMKQKHDQKMELKQTKKPVDGVDLFLASVAQSMRKLPRRQLHKAKVAILNVIAAAEDESEWEAAASPVSSNSPSNNSASMNITMIRPSTAGSSTSESPHLVSESLFVPDNRIYTGMENSTFY